MLLKTFHRAFAVTGPGLVAGVLYDGWTALGLVAVLAVPEVSLSFDNAVINAGILKKLNAFRQKIFLTIGILIAVVGMRLLFPVVIVAVTARLTPLQAVHPAPTDKDRYQEPVTDAHPFGRSVRRDVPVDDLPRLRSGGPRDQVARPGRRTRPTTGSDWAPASSASAAPSSPTPTWSNGCVPASR